MNKRRALKHIPANADNEEHLGLSGDVDLSTGLGDLLGTDLVGGDLAVLGDVLLGTAEDDLALGLQALQAS